MTNTYAVLPHDAIVQSAVYVTIIVTLCMPD